MKKRNESIINELNLLLRRDFCSEDLIIILEQLYPDTYEKSVGVWEKYTLKQHTLMVMGQFEKYFSCKDLPLDFNREIFRLFLALHDIGKPMAISKEGKHLQHKYTQEYISKLFKELGIDSKHFNLVMSLVSSDPIGGYLTEKLDEEKTKEVVRQMAECAGVNARDFFKLLCIYYKVDAGSYTENAGGLKSLDHLFVFDEDNRELNFAINIQHKMDRIDL